MSRTMFLLFVCLNFVVNSSSGSHLVMCGSKEKNTIHLPRLPAPELSSRKDRQALKKINDIFMEKCQQFYDIQLSDFPTRVNDTIREIENGKNVVNLWVSDYYNNTFGNEVNETLVYAGDIFYHQATPTRLHNKKGTKRNPEIEKRLAKVVSKSIINMNSGDLVDFISSIQYDDSNNITSRQSCLKQATATTDLKTVLICNDGNNIMRHCFKHMEPYSETLDFQFKRKGDCAEYINMFQNNILAVLSPTPFETKYEISIPTVFYTTPYMKSEYKTQFPNSMSLVSGLLLKYAFMKFINDAGWRRVAIISDDSPYSIEFEKEILQMFRDQKMIYNVQRCENTYDCQQAIDYLKRVDARIIIANLREENARRLTQQFQLEQTWFTILFRVPPFWNFQIKKWISITMGPSESGYTNCLVNNKPVCYGIMQGLNIVAYAREYHSQPKTLHRATFYREFAQTMMTTIQGSTAHIRRQSDIISKMHITKYGEIINVNPNNSPFDKMIPDQKGCIAKTNNFARPCDHAIYLYLMLVIIVFAITLLTITCYFDETSPLVSTTYQQF